MKKRFLAALMAVAVAAGTVAGGTWAYLTSKTETVENVFTVGKVKIDLTENTGEKGDKNQRQYKMVPGNDIKKDPTVTVLASSEECYVIVEVKESADLNGFVTWEIGEGWTELPSGGIGGPKRWWRIVPAADQDQKFGILKENTLKVKETVTSEMMEKIEDGKNYPTLEFKAYAIQRANVRNESDAWDKLN
ncbi:MAG: SipW-dependent-type signal peptide-containing protein [Eubacteriales bacterium]|nr:SipW-dependent-type signal peptide-containing protein [Eubacteriales bacterium]